MNEQMNSQPMKRNTAYKLRIGSIVSGKPVIEAERLKSIETEGKQVSRVNLIANVIDKFIQEGEKKFASITLDDATGQIKLKTFGEEIEKLSKLNQGDTILAIGTLRSWNNEVYITPEIVKLKSPSYLLLRKLEAEADQPKPQDKEQLFALKDKMVGMIKDAEKDGGINIEQIITDLKERPDLINQEIKRLLEEGLVYEPRPGKLRYLG